MCQGRYKELIGNRKSRVHLQDDIEKKIRDDLSPFSTFYRIISGRIFLVPQTNQDWLIFLFPVPQGLPR